LRVRQLLLTIAELAAAGNALRVRCAGGELEPAPGQFYLAWVNTPVQPFLRLPVFPFHTAENGLEFWIEPPHPYAALQPGETLDVFGPCGRGFALPVRAAHLVVKCDSPARLMGLIHRALASRLSVTVLLPEAAPLPELPLDVEIVRGPLTAELAQWADMVALDVPAAFAEAQAIRALCPTRPAEFVQALVVPPMPCGTGACQACWVEIGSRPRRLACVDGPVFHL
jgi:hypothetical protein